jgi:hypothetical protein
MFQYPLKAFTKADPDKPDPYSMDTFIAWMDRQTGTYDFSNADKCAFTQYLRAMGLDSTWGGCEVGCGQYANPYAQRLFMQVRPALAYTSRAAMRTFEQATQILKAMRRYP